MWARHPALIGSLAGCTAAPRRSRVPRIDCRAALSQGPRRNGLRPALDVTLESAAAQRGSAVIGVVLTGMGHDGVAGARCVKAAGGVVIAEAESTAAVYGMPRGVVEAGLADYVAPLPEIPALLTRLVAH